MAIKSLLISIVVVLTMNLVGAQELEYAKDTRSTFDRARTLAYEGDHNSAKSILLGLLENNPGHTEARTLLAQTYSWDGQYNAARREFNQVTSGMRSSVAAWVGAIKNELYAKNEQIALGLANKAIHHLGSHVEINRLKQISEKRILSKDYPQKGWHNVSSKVLGSNIGSSAQQRTIQEKREKKEEAIVDETLEAEKTSEKKATQ